MKQDWEEAVKWYRRSAEQEDPRAQYHLAWCQEFGKGVPRDLDAAARLYRQAADQDYAPAVCALGRCYETGQGVRRDAGRATARHNVSAINAAHTALRAFCF